MIINLLYSLISIANNSTNFTFQEQVLGDRGCGLGSEDIFFINSNNDINSIKDCNILNGSLFINGDYNIDTLQNLSNINDITGYLVIYDSHMLKNLKGLNNLKNINAENPYLLNYGITIKYNNNNYDNSSGLCFSNLVNWSKITTREIIILNNRMDCPNCHNECNGCFGPGRLLCQECKNYISGDACVSMCPNGTVTSSNTCIEKEPTENINLEFNRLDDEYKLNLSWIEPNYPNGFITDYILIRDGNEIFRSFYNNDGYYSNDYLFTNYIDTLPKLESNYNYQIAYSNKIGTTVSNNQNYFMSNRIPQKYN